MLEKLRNFDVDRMDIDQLVELSAVGRILAEEYDKTGAEVPEWVTVNVKQLRREVKARCQDALEKSLIEKRKKLDGLLPAEDRRKKLADEIAELESKLQSV